MPTIYKRPKPKPKRIYRNDTGRRGERQDIYNTPEWVRLRHAKFLAQPLCEMCEMEGRAVPADDIHHIVSFMTVPDGDARKALAYDMDNLMSLCRQCHLKVHHGISPYD